MSKCKIILFADIHYLDKRPEKNDLEDKDVKITEHHIRI